MDSIKRLFSKKKLNSLSDRETFACLYENTYLAVFRYINGLSGGPQQEAEDLTIETYVRAWSNRHHFQGNDQAVMGWLLSIAKNLVIDFHCIHTARALAEEVDITLLVDPHHLPELDVIAREQIASLWQMLKTLPEGAREMPP